MKNKKQRKAKRQARGQSMKARAVTRRGKRLPNRGATIVQSNMARQAALQARPRPTPLGGFLGDLDAVYLPQFGPARPAGVAIPGRPRRASVPGVFLPGGPFDPIG